MLDVVCNVELRLTIWSMLPTEVAYGEIHGLNNKLAFVLSVIFVADSN